MSYKLRFNKNKKVVIGLKKPYNHYKTIDKIPEEDKIYIDYKEVYGKEN